MARVAINIDNTTEETVNVDENNPVPVEETEHAENTKEEKKLIQSDQLRFLLPPELENLMRLQN